MKMKMKSLLVLAIVASLSFGDTIYFKNGAIVDGQISEENDNTVTINSDGNSVTYSMNDIKKVDRTLVSAPPPPPPPASVSSISNTKVIAAGTVMHIVTTETLNTKQHKSGHQFRVNLESDLISNGIAIAKSGDIVYGVVLQSKQAGRLAGKSSMVIELNAISINGKRISIHTNELNAMNEAGQGKNTVGKLARGAAIGGLANGSKGARNGAKIGAGAAILTRGEATGVPAGTMLSFTIVSDTKL